MQKWKKPFLQALIIFNLLVLLQDYYLEKKIPSNLGKHETYKSVKKKKKIFCFTVKSLSMHYVHDIYIRW